MSIVQLEAAATALGDELLGDVVFLGGATVALWLTDPAARSPRVTLDVDVVAEVTTLGEYERFQTRLRARGFREDAGSDVLCRWRGADGMILDAIPADARLAGIDDHWMPHVVRSSILHTLPTGTQIRAVPPPWLLVLKLAAFNDRGHHDVLASHDFEDIVVLVDGRAELPHEAARLPDDARAHVVTTLEHIQTLSDYPYGVEGALPDPDARDRAAAVTIPRFAEILAAASE